MTRMPPEYYDNWPRERLIEQIEDLREIIRESIDNNAQANKAMDAAINPNGEKRDFIPAARALHAELNSLRAALAPFIAFSKQMLDGELPMNVAADPSTPVWAPAAGLVEVTVGDLQRAAALASASHAAERHQREVDGHEE